MKSVAIESITALSRDAAGLIERTHEQRAPIVITQRGRARAVLLDIATYEEERRAFELLKIALQGEQAVAVGQYVSPGQHRARVRSSLRGRR